MLEFWDILQYSYDLLYTIIVDLSTSIPNLCQKRLYKNHLCT